MQHNLHCDVADAVNVMHYADNKTSGNNSTSPSASVWHIFPFESLDKILLYISKYKNLLEGVHPIYDHQIYLTEEDLHKLKEEYEVEPWTIYQNEGDAVFVQAGCAYQVTNYYNSIKCAFDIISPENIGRAVYTSEQLRKLKQEDKLQIYTTLAHAWISLVKITKKRAAAIKKKILAIKIIGVIHIVE